MAPYSTYVSLQRNSLYVILDETLKKALEIGLYQQEANKSAEDALSEAKENCAMPEESLMNDEPNE